MLPGCQTLKQDCGKRICCLECTWGMLWVRERKAGTLSIPIRLGKGAVSSEQSCLKGICSKLLLPFPCHHLWKDKEGLTRHVQFLWSVVHNPFSCLVHVSCRQRRGLFNSQRMCLGKTPLHQRMQPVTRSKNLLHEVSTWAPSSVSAERTVILTPTERLEWWLSGNTVAEFSKKCGCDVTNLVMTDTWETSNVADHGMVDC